MRAACVHAHSQHAFLVYLSDWPISCSLCVQACFSVYLLYVLKFILQDFCIVCTTFHAINFSMLFLAAIPIHRNAKKLTAKRKGL